MKILFRRLLYGRHYSEQSDHWFHDEKWEAWEDESKRGPFCEHCGLKLADPDYPNWNGKSPKLLNGMEVCEACYDEGTNIKKRLINGTL